MVIAVCAPFSASPLAVQADSSVASPKIWEGLKKSGGQNAWF